MAVPVRRWCIPVALLISLVIPATPQTASEPPSPPSSFRDPDALQLLQRSLTMLGGSTQWSGHSSLQAAGTVTLLKKDYSVVWSDDWGGNSIRSIRQSTSTAGTRTFTADASHGSWMKVNGQKTRSADGKLSDAVPMHLPAVLLAKVLSDSHLSVKAVANHDRLFPNDQSIEVQESSNPFTKQNWLINPVTGMPDRVVLQRTEHNHPNHPLPVTVTYSTFAASGGRSVATAYTVDVGQVHEVVSLSSFSFDIPVSTNP